MVWPSITVCNLNQVEASFMKNVKAHGNVTLTNLLINEFFLGRVGNLSDEHQLFVDDVSQILGNFTDSSHQRCNDMFIGMKFRGKELTWRFEEYFVPYLYPTDFGACCFFTPHFLLEQYDPNKTIAELYHGLKADSKNGASNGFDLVLDVEQWNYAYYDADAAGFQISLHHHADKPMIQFLSQLINPGMKTLINLKPSVSYTTDAAISRFYPEDRMCYNEGEVNLKYLTYVDGFRYNMNNCLIDQGMHDIIWNCRCLPRFYVGCDGCDSNYFDFLEYCTGKGLHCANARMESLGLGEISEENDIIVPEALKSPTLIGKISKPDKINCIPACRIQENTNQMSYAPYPQLENFFYQKNIL